MDRELQVAVSAAISAGRAIRKIYDQKSFSVEQKADDKGPLTEADLAANTILIDAISAAFPDDHILSEETKDDLVRLNKSRVWIIDPLDGTREFTLGVPEFVVSVGFTVDGAARVGVLYQPVTEDLIAGVVGLGTTLNGEPVSVTDHKELKGGRFLVSRSEYEKGWFDDYKDTAILRPMGSVAYKLGLVAAGKAEATFTPKPRNEWDLCGGVACILAAGGQATNGKGEPYRFNEADPLNIGVCGTNGSIHSTILRLIQDR